MSKSKIAFVTGSRADYGIMRRYLHLLNQDDSIQLSILVTGALLDERYGKQVSLIEEDRFFIEEEFPVAINSSSNAAVLHNMAETLDRFGNYFETHHYDLLIILGDRYEMLSVAIAAAMQRLCILHIHGGEATYANYDEFIRHAITKMSRFHFTATEVYRRRVIQLGEAPDHVFNLGALGAENCLFIDEKNVPEIIKNLPDKKYFVILFHPETLTNKSTFTQINELLDAVSRHLDYTFVFLGSNADTHADIIRKNVHDFVNGHKNCVYFENLHTDAYHYLLQHSICLIGNSSSGIIEAPSLGIYTINIGDRQSGRVRGNSVIDVRCVKDEISNAIHKVLVVHRAIHPVNPYYQENSAIRYYNKTKEILLRINSGSEDAPKVFYDVLSSQKKMKK
ncbi:UDP-N-acetylglucosamine 2-epimerase [Acidaminococcus massiliensis]|uniref:UDP-N-acetylglucosamine 2-epimerase n=1 Tax=Acidaminococcus massiliensis TaxID=1852375 RepID=UPI0026DD5795|nr:UDP-N-acetylglucosamine 2-epimerase [Acidaminococcus massiliensis]